MLDLDLFDYPLLPHVMDVSKRYILPSKEAEHSATKFHAICANGRQRGKLRGGETNLRHRYYDSFATVLLPDTWLHRKETGMSPEDVLDWFLEEGRDENNSAFHPVPVRSCFGGLTLYPADFWLSSCRYDQFSKDSLGYKGGKEHHTCEHILFDECLREKFSNEENPTNSIGIAVQPGY